MRLIAAAAAVLLLAGCAVQQSPTSAPTDSPSPDPTPSPTATAEPEAAPAYVQPSGDATVVATGLSAPWSIVRLRTGTTLISERDTGVIKELTSGGVLRDIGTVPDVARGGEGGLLGLAYVRAGNGLYAYLTTAGDNRIVRFELVGDPGAYSLGAGTPILTGLEKASNHNGGRIKIGPDGLLYATVGDAGQPWISQDLNSYNGKILRMELDGSVPSDNPFPGSLVYSLGHRNPQGLAWDDSGQLWASEFGQNTWDELNAIVPGGNYGWPVAEGIAGEPGFIDPHYQWRTDVASPSGLAFTSDTLFLAALRGQRLWTIYTESTTAVEWYAGTYGRIRDVVPGPGGTLWILTNNTDGRGTPRAGDDQILQVSLTPLG